MSQENLYNDFFSLMKNYPQANDFIRKLQKNNQMFLFGGAVRKYIESGNNFFEDNLPRDFDFVLKKQYDFNLDDIFQSYNYKKNRFGGYKVILNNLTFDVWELSNTWAIKNKYVELSEKKLCETVFLNIDAIVYDFHNKKLYDEKYQEAKKKRCLEMVLEKNPCKELNLVRSMIFKQKYQMSYSDKLKAVFEEYACMEKKLSDILYDIQIEHYGSERISHKSINEEITNIMNRKYINKCKYLES